MQLCCCVSFIFPAIHSVNVILVVVVRGGINNERKKEKTPVRVLCVTDIAGRSLSSVAPFNTESGSLFDQLHSAPLFDKRRPRSITPLRVLRASRSFFSPLLANSGPSRSLYQPLTPSQYVSRWRPMRDRCFNIGSALIYSNCRLAFLSALCLAF